MKKIVLFIFSALSISVYAQNLGVGGMIGEPTGVNFKKWVELDRAYDGGFGWSFGSEKVAHLYGDYLWIKKDALYINEVHPLDIHFGVGGRMKFADEVELGPRFPVGIDYFFMDETFELFLEIAALFNVVPKSQWEGNGLVGLRVYF